MSASLVVEGAYSEAHPLSRLRLQAAHRRDPAGRIRRRIRVVGPTAW